MLNFRTTLGFTGSTGTRKVYRNLLSAHSSFHSEVQGTGADGAQISENSPSVFQSYAFIRKSVKKKEKIFFSNAPYFANSR